MHVLSLVRGFSAAQLENSISSRRLIFVFVFRLGGDDKITFSLKTRIEYVMLSAAGPKSQIRG